jgi:hypothetical protein
MKATRRANSKGMYPNMRPGRKLFEEGKTGREEGGLRGVCVRVCMC